MKLKSKIYLYTSVLFAVLLALVCASVYLLFEKMSLDDETSRIETEAELIAGRVRENASEVAPDDLLRAYAPADGMLRIVRAGGSSLPAVTTGDAAGLAQAPYAYRDSRATERLDDKGHGYIRVSVPVIWTDGEVVSLQVSRSIADTENRLVVLRTVLVLVALLALIPAVFASRVLANRIVRPIAALTGTMGDIRRSGKFQRIETKAKQGDELAEMERKFNEMIGLLEANFLRQERFVSDASHELKTPLTIIESYASLLRRRGRERPEVFDEAVDAILSESVRMRELTEQLLQLARRPDAESLELSETDLAECARESARSFSGAYGRTIGVEAPAAVRVLTDASKVRQLLFILLDNARKYSEGDIEVKAHSGGEGAAALSVTDKGIGIPADELPKVFDRFYRVDVSRTRQQDAGGSGLGLSLAKDIADALGAEIRIDSEPGEGTTVWLMFPEAREAADEWGESRHARSGAGRRSGRTEERRARKGAKRP
ncbi:HAMP domain-containing sensor histidine kinase [Saccharibacillus sp. CPCC 101409]|uniref:sensor histidine kinase n=1 Tax=Saccharibacillus sp. CPCC 101409 TaxID=3058041 RepID=UPI0026712C01|nr:HAMP domain-containing sensor histidine kinase [Saccharibacillus sp. CPCC 101409]MDO3410252.1 HAMP domain-containing sensor histidine kinase [Saccharibacillus sp. CPCC 101409]